MPVENIDVLSHFGSEDLPVPLDKLGGAGWQARKARVKQRLREIAQQLIRTAAARAVHAGATLSPPEGLYDEFAARFPNAETEDQQRAIDEVTADLASGRPMDRLVCGDVGFGKTEVALRAAFVTAMSGKQVGVVVPTTLLARQHFATFRERFAGLPIEIGQLSRLVGTKLQRDVRERLAAGTLDIVIGTHALLSKSIRFRDLGLLVVDEEQHFGVKQKERLKALREDVHVLTLTATPIPRTLEMALTGIRSVSRISTPPEDRHPILTFVGPYDEQAVSAAIRREMLREGQVFYVHNRIQSIDHAVARIRDLVPEARLAVAHGRMNEGELEQVMLDFWNGDYDVLVATTIIESGLDLPQVNTLVVERADLLGLAQLYQLRGRVGRSSQRAYAYLFHPAGHILSEDAYRRLEAVGEFGELGSGFQLAMRDLEIRGAGSVLGNVQSGHLNAVGFDLYVELVAEAVREMETGTVSEEPRPEVRIELPVTAHLPDDYVTDQAARLEAYRRLAAASAQSEVDDVAAEWGDRSGPLPPNAEALIEIARLRVEALRIGLAEVVHMRNEVKLEPVELSASQEVRLQRLAPRAVLSGRGLFVPAPEESPAQALADFLREMWPPEPV